MISGAKEIRATKESEAFASDGDDIPENVNQIDFTAKDVPRYWLVIRKVLYYYRSTSFRNPAAGLLVLHNILFDQPSQPG